MFSCVFISLLLYFGRWHMWKEFKNFVSRGNVVGLAIGLTIGVAFSAIVNSLVNDIIIGEQIKPLLLEW